MFLSRVSTYKMALVSALIVQMVFPSPLWAADALSDKKAAEIEQELFKRESAMSSQGALLYRMNGEPIGLAQLMALGVTEYKMVTQSDSGDVLAIHIKSSADSEALLQNRARLTLKAYDDIELKTPVVAKTTIALDQNLKPDQFKVLMKERLQDFESKISDHYQAKHAAKSGEHQSFLAKMVSFFIPSANAAGWGPMARALNPHFLHGVITFACFSAFWGLLVYSNRPSDGNWSGETGALALVMSTFITLLIFAVACGKVSDFCGMDS